MRKHELVYALNAGGVDPQAVARVDLEKMRLAGEHPVDNLMPLVLGPATLSPGSQNLARITADAETRMVRFSRSVGNSYMLLLSPSEMRVVLDDAVQQVPSVATLINSGSWSNVSTSPATATGGATLTFAATRTASARLRQTVGVATGDQVKTNILRVVVSAGPVFLRVGTTAGGFELLADAELDTGTHKIGIYPGSGTGTIYVEVRADDDVARSVSQIQFESALIGGTGDLVLPTPWSTIAAIEAMRAWQSIDVLFCGDGATQQRRIEHRGALSWGISLYKTDDGPFVGGSSRVSMTPSAQTGNTVITSSEGFFSTRHEGALFEITQRGKVVTSTFNAVNQTSDYVTIIGVDAGRYFHRTGVGTAFVGTIVIERSFDASDPVSWTTFETYVDGAVSFAKTQVDDTLDNMTVHYRYRVSAYTSGSAVMTLEYDSGVQVGRARLLSQINATSINCEVLVPFGNTGSSRSWRIGEWSTDRGWPRIPVIHDGRLHWFRDDTDYASKPDDYTFFDDSFEGDSMPLARSVGTGGEEGVVWALSMDRLIVGTPAFEAVITASELDEPLTPTAYTVRKPSRRGCADIQAVGHDDGVFFVQRSGRRVYELSAAEGSSRLRSQDISRLNPTAFASGVVDIAVQQQPDTRLYSVMDDGSLVITTFERDDKVIAVTTRTIAGGLVEDVEIIPNIQQDDVYLIVNRSGARYLEKFAPEREQIAVSTCALLDGHKVLTGSVSSITGATHFAGETVQVWADGARRSDVTIDGSGNAALGATYARVVYGKRYYGSFNSVKLAYAAGLGSAVGQTKMVRGVGLILRDSCLDGVRVGPDANYLDPMPDYVNGALRTANQFFTHYDADVMPINSDWTPDARIYVQIDSAEGPCTLQAIVLDIETHDGAATGNG